MAETVSSELPAWLQRRASFTDSGVSRDMQVGIQLAQQWQQNQRLQRAQELQEEARRLALDEKERVAQGAVEITQVLSKMGQAGNYTDPALQAEFWDKVSRNPKFAGSPAFKDIMDTFQNAEQAKTRGELERLKQTAISERNLDSIDSRFGLLSQRLDGLMQMEGLRQEGRQSLESMRGEINILRDQLKGGIASSLEAQRQGGRADLETQRQAGRFDLQRARDEGAMNRLSKALDNAIKLQGVKAEDSKELQEFKHELDVMRDSLKPTRTGALIHDLPESELVAMRSELATLDNLFKEKKIKGTKKPGAFTSGYTETPEAEYERRKREILKSYDSKRIGTPKPAAAPNSDKRVRVVSPDGKVGNIPESQLEEALKQGYKPAP